MLGTPSDPGVIQRACDHIFAAIGAETQESKMQFLITVTYLEVYNEKLSDLLVPVSRTIDLHRL